MGHARLGVTHRRRRIAFDRSEIALPIDKRFTHRPWLSHMYKRRINYRLAMGMIITAGISADFRAFAVLPPGKKGKIMHRVENATLRRLKPIARIRKRAMGLSRRS